MGLYLNQREVFLGTVWDNIIDGRSHITSQEIIDLAEQSGLSGFLDQLPEGFQTQVAPNGKNLPGHYIKRISLLRALLNKPLLLLLEDPWDGLAGHEKQKLRQYLTSRPNNATVIVAANDQAFLEACDYKIVLSDGTATLTENFDNGSGEL